MALTASPRAQSPRAARPARSAWPALALALLAAALVILWAGRRTTFLGDEWGWIFSALHPNSGTFLNPDNGHLVAFTQAFYNLLLRIAGLGDYGVFRAAALVLHLAVAVGVFVLARRRLSDWAALVPAVLVALLGTGADAFLGAINVGFLAASAAGVAALALIDEDTPKTDAGACALLILALASWTSAVAITAGVFAELIFRRSPRRLWVAVVPALLYAFWRLHWAGGLFSNIGVAGAPHPSAFGVLTHALQAATGAIAGVAGVQLMSPTLHAHFPWLSSAADVVVAISVIGLAAVAVVAWRRGRARSLSPRLGGLLVSGLVLWLLLGVARGTLGNTYASRYVYAGGVVVVLAAVEVAARVRPGPRLGSAILAAAALSVALNIVWMVVWGNHLRQEAALSRAQLAGLDIAGAGAPATFAPASSEFALANVTAVRYFAARRRFGGTPADTAAQLAQASEATREAADNVLGRALGPRLTGARAAPPGRPSVILETASGAVVARHGNCVDATAPAGLSSLTFTAPAAGGVVISMGRAGVALLLARRFADRFTVGVGGLRPGARATLVAPLGGATQPWHMRAFLRGSARFCTSGPY